MSAEGAIESRFGPPERRVFDSHGCALRARAPDRETRDGLLATVGAGPEVPCRLVGALPEECFVVGLTAHRSCPIQPASDPRERGLFESFDHVVG